MDKGGLTYEFEQAAEYSVLSLKPAMNSSDWTDIEQAGDSVIRDLEAAGTPHLIVDISELDYMGSAMVALLVRFWKIVKAKNARMVVVVRNPLVLEVLQIARLDAVWEIAEYREDALHELGLSPEAKSERRESNVLVLAGAGTAVLGAVALTIYTSKPDWLGLRVAQVLAYGCSVIGLVLGTMLLAKATGFRRLLGGLAAVLGLAVLVAAFFRVPLTADANEPDNSPQKEATGQEGSETPKKSSKGDRKSRPGETPKSGVVKPAVAEKPAPRTDDE